MPAARLSFRSSDPAIDARWRCFAGVGDDAIVAAADTGAARWSRGGVEIAGDGDPLVALDWLARDGRRWAGFVNYELNRFIERLPRAGPTTTPLLAFWPAGNFVGRTVERESTFAPAAIARRSKERDRYVADVRRAIEYIAAGDVFQVNLSHSFDVETSLDAAAIFGELPPALLGATIALDGGTTIVSNSPELFFRIEPLPGGRRRITTRPIKGTRPRGPGMRDALERSEKDRAELAMIVDLERNDLGRICEIGSVHVVEPRVIEAHPTVYHGVATIEGFLRRDVTLADVFRAMFPCGSITGCPKVRAMEIIDELEREPRGPYCGAIGYVDADGSAEFSVAIRTMTLASGIARVSVGGGIVADSDPADEYRETIDKARAMLSALGMSREQIDALRAE